MDLNFAKGAAKPPTGIGLWAFQYAVGRRTRANFVEDRPGSLKDRNKFG